MATKKPFWKQSNVRGGLLVAVVGLFLFPSIPIILQLVWGPVIAKLWLDATTIGAAEIAGQKLPQLTYGHLIVLIGAVWLLWPKLIEAWHEWRGKTEVAK